MTSRVTAGLIAGRYEVLREIGRGGMATVVEARDRERDVVVAVKRLREDIASAVNTARFLREVGLARSLEHPGILPLLDSGTGEDGLPYYVMPLVEGESLRERLVRERQLPVDEALAIVLQVADALAFAHSRGVVHRDVTPANILLAGSRAYLADFGIARAVLMSDGDTLTSTGIVIGTPEFMSPEQGAGDHAVDERGDLYALGSVLYTCLAGEPPFTGPSQQSVLARKAVARAPSVRDLRPVVSRQLAAAIARALEQVPADRFRTMPEFAAALRARPDAGVSNSRRTRSVAVIAALVAVTAVTLALVSTTHDRRAGAARRAIDAGDVQAAVSPLRQLVSRDSTDASSALLLAQALLLGGFDSTAEWRRAVSLATPLHRASDSLRAEGLAALRDGRLEVACRDFRALRQREPDDRSAPFDLATCLARDVAVVPDARAGSGWRFRASRNEAIALFDQVLRGLPRESRVRPVIYRELVRLYVAEWGALRAGRSAADTTRSFAAFPSLVKAPAGDTLVYEPHPLSEFRSGRAWMDPPGLEAAIEHDRSALRATATAWVEAEPDVGQAHEALSRALELTGELTSATPDAASALSEIVRARRLARTPVQGLMDAFSQVRLSVKNGDFGAARMLADSMTRQWPTPDRVTIQPLSALLALTGRARALASEFESAAPYYVARMPDGHDIHPNAVLARSALRFSAFAQVGGPRDSVLATRRRVEQELRSYVSVQARDSVRVALIVRPISLAVPLLGAASVAGLPRATSLIGPQQSLARGNMSAVRLALDSLRGLRSGHAAAAAGVDQVYQEAWLRLASGDTVAAETQLDDTLNGLAALGTQFLVTIAEASAVGRAMTLRAQLAARRGSPAVARKWSDSARALLADADAELQAR